MPTALWENTVSRKLARVGATTLAALATLAIAAGCTANSDTPPPPAPSTAATAACATPRSNDLVINCVSVQTVAAQAKRELGLPARPVVVVPKDKTNETCVDGFVVDGSEGQADGFYICDNRELAVAGVVADKLKGQPRVVTWYVVSANVVRLKPGLKSAAAQICAASFVAARSPYNSSSALKQVVAFVAKQQGDATKYVNQGWKAGASGSQSATAACGKLG